MRTNEVKNIKNLEELKSQYRSKEKVIDDALNNIVKSMINHQFAMQLHQGSTVISFNKNDIGSSFHPYMDQILTKLKEFGLEFKLDKKTGMYTQELV